MPDFEVLTGNSHHGFLTSQDTASYFHKRLEGKVAIITGGAHGIGEATVHLFARHGAIVIIADIDDLAGEALAASLPPSVTFLHCDVSQEIDVELLISSTLAHYGKLDILCNIAGVLGRQTTETKTITELDVEEFDLVMKVNVRGAALGMKHAARAMISRKSGSIVSMASVAGVQGGLGPHAYTTSKHAVVGLTKNAACELGKHGIRVNCVSPFGVATRMLVNAWRDEGCKEVESLMKDEDVEKIEEFVRGLGNLKGATLTAADVAEAALYLVSDEAKYVSGHNLVVDGGVTCCTNLIGL